MKKNRILCVLLALVLAVTLIPPAAAAGTPTVSLSSGSVKAGETVTLTVSIRDNPGLAAWILYIYYDTDVFTADPSGDVRSAGEFREDGTLMCNTIATAKANGRYYGDAGQDGVLAYWFNSSGANTVGDGQMLTVRLTAKADAPNGTYRVGIGYSEKDTCSGAGKRVALRTEDGTVTVSGGSSGGTQQPEGKPVPAFTDVNGHWAYDYIEDAAQLGLMEGYQNLFRPNDSMTRCEFVTALWRAMGKPAASKASTFTDLDQNWYLPAVAWAQENNIIQGTGGDKFEPYWPVSREQVVLILHRLAGEPRGMELMLTGTYDSLFKDSGTIHDWAKGALYWAVYEEIYCGVTSPNVGTTLAPTADATRAHIAIMLVRYLNVQGGV